jgi:hypothetical protein
MANVSDITPKYPARHFINDANTGRLTIRSKVGAVPRIRTSWIASKFAHQDLSRWLDASAAV